MPDRRAGGKPPSLAAVQHAPGFLVCSEPIEERWHDRNQSATMGGCGGGRRPAWQVVVAASGGVLLVLAVAVVAATIAGRRRTRPTYGPGRGPAPRCPRPSLTADPYVGTRSTLTTRSSSDLTASCWYILSKYQGPELWKFRCPDAQRLDGNKKVAIKSDRNKRRRTMIYFLNKVMEGAGLHGRNQDSCNALRNSRDAIILGQLALNQTGQSWG